MNKNMEILLVEDNPDHAELTLRALKDENFPCRIQWLKNGQEALDYLLFIEKNKMSQLPHFILLDIKLPKLNGLEVLKKVKENDNLKNVPIIMLTTSDRSEEIIGCYQLGVNSFIVKPVKFEEFYEKVRSIKEYWTKINRGPESA
ncbi:MAG: response regulator [Nitrospirae bacterium]|nr:response regulator [Nitrospirota bacterium]MBI3594698.1 response regulator [Nitrospirota bacterium]